jgi:hypothetical protein
MEHFYDVAVSQKTNDSININHPDREKSSQGISGFFPAIVNMIAEDGENFFSYLKALGLSRENNLVVLSSKHHYYYDEEELKSVKTLVNLKRLNMIKYLDEFLFTLVQVLPPYTNFLGCFSDSGTSGKNDTDFFISLRTFRRFFNALDPGTDRIMDRNQVSEILEAHGFKITNMTEMNGLVYFCSQKVDKAAILRA